LEDEELEERRKEMRAKWRRGCGLPQELLGKTFKNFDRSRHGSAVAACRSWAGEFDLDNPKGQPTLILYSAVAGVGKTHLMAAVVNSALDHWNGPPGEYERRCPICFESGPSLVRRVRGTYGLRPNDYHHEREEDIYNELRGVSLLLLDDVGKEKPSDFTRELYWYLINERVTSGLPVVMSTRLRLEDLHGLMHEDTVDRLYGMAQGKVIELKGQSYRRIKKVA